MKNLLFGALVLLMGTFAFAINASEDYSFPEDPIEIYNLNEKIILPLNYSIQDVLVEEHNKIMAFVELEDNSILILEKIDNKYFSITSYRELSDNSLIFSDIETGVEFLKVSFDNDNSKLLSITNLSSVAVGCTSSCIRDASNSCMADTSCSLTCALSGPYCPAAIAASCAVTCQLTPAWPDEDTPRN